MKFDKMAAAAAAAVVLVICGSAATAEPAPNGDSSAESESLARAIALVLLETQILYRATGPNGSSVGLADGSAADRADRVTAAAILKLWSDPRRTEAAMELLKRTVAAEVLEDDDSGY